MAANGGGVSSTSKKEMKEKSIGEACLNEEMHQKDLNEDKVVMRRTRIIDGELVGVVAPTQTNVLENNQVSCVNTAKTTESLDTNETRQSIEMTDEDDKPSEKLCGWLKLSSSYMHAARGFMSKLNSVIKYRWFVYGDKTCKLFYYRNAQDLLPLGEIDISNATFYFDASKHDHKGEFEIRCPGRVFHLDASDRPTMMFWLQALQTKRKEYSLKRRVLKDRVGFTPMRNSKHFGGLLGSRNQTAEVLLEENEKPNIGQNEVNLQIPTDPSPSNVGQDAAAVSPNKFSVLSLNSLRSEILGAVENFRMQISPNTNNEAKSVSPPPSPSSSTSCDSWTVLNGLNEEAGNRPDSLHPQFSKQQPAQGKKIVNAFKNFKKLGKRDRSSTDLSEQMSVCQRCKEFQNKISVLQDDLKICEEELNANREIVKLLQREIDLQRREIHTRFTISEGSPFDVTELLNEKDSSIVDLEHKLAHKVEQKSLADQENRKMKVEEQVLKEEIEMLKDMLTAKTETIVQLTNQIYELETSVRHVPNDVFDTTDVPSIEFNKFNQPESVPSISSCDSVSSINTEDMGAVVSESADIPARFSFPAIHVSSPTQQSETVNQISPTIPVVSITTQELDSLRDSCHAYEQQNKFLTKEILELNDLRKHDEDREKELVLSYTKLEAQFYQNKSKYLYLLEELKTPKLGGEESKSEEAIRQLLQDALYTELDEQIDKETMFSSNSNKEYDRYGFLKTYIDEDTDDVLSIRAQELERRSQDVKDADEVTSNLVKWENFMVGFTGKGPLQRCSEVKALIRLGIPYEYRETIWKGCVNLWLGITKNKLGPQYYKDVLNRTKNSKLNPAAKQIELDLLRTLPNNCHYQSIEDEGIRKLRNVLLAYSQHNLDIGYCQGLNRIAAIILLFLPEEEAFWCLIAIVDCIMPKEYYSKTMAGAQTDQRVLKDIVQEKLPRLYAHFELHELDLSLFTFNWFLTIFVDNASPELFLRIWDAFLYEGSKVMFRFAIAQFKHCEEEILQQDSAFKISRYMRTIGDKMTSSKQIAKIAFGEIKNFPMRNIASRRQYYMQQVKAELEELDAIRQDFKTQHIPEDRREYYSDDEFLD